MSKTKITNRMKPWVTEEGLLLIQGWARDGLTNEDIAKNIGINPKTLYSWMDRYTPLREALRLGKEPADRKVENALYENALGYEWEEEQAIKLKDEYWKDGKKHSKERVEIVTVKKKRPPDPSSTFFWLKNRKQNEWRDKQDIEHSGGVEVKENKLADILNQLQKDDD